MNFRKNILATVAILFIGIPVFAQHQNTVGLDMIDIEAGSFLMGDAGCGKNFDEQPAHIVKISNAFRISSTEVTNIQYEMFDAEHKSLRGKNGFSKEDDEAVIYVSYQDATNFCKWLSEKENKTYRLPTEAEWEYACRAGTMSPYAIGDRALPKVMLKNQETVWDPKPVSLKVKDNKANAWGIYDMHGNVEEWCLDYYGSYSAKEKVDPAGYVDGLYRVVRGGSHNTPVAYLRSANRSALMPEDKTLFTGFRIVEVLNNNEKLHYTSRANESFPKQIRKNWIVETKAVFKEPLSFIHLNKREALPYFFHHNHCPAVSWLPNGDMLAIWFSTEDEKDREMTILSSRLKAGAKEWTQPELFFDVPDRNMTGSSLFYDEDTKTLYHTNGVEAAGTWKHLALIIRESKDNGYTWSKPRFVNAEHEMGNQVIAGMFKTQEGYLIQPCDATPTVRGGSVLHISKDGGKTWNSQDGNKEFTPVFKEGASGNKIAGIHAGVVQLTNGNLMAFGRDDNIKQGNQYYMAMSLSTDMGATWTYSATEFSPISSGQRLILKRLNEGALLLVSFTDARIDPESKKGMNFESKSGKNIGYGMYAAISYDDGKTWPVKKLLTDGKERYLYGGAFTGNFKMDANNAEPKGYLALTQSPDNIIHLFSSALHYQFNLQWLLD